MKSQTFSGIEVLGNMSWGTHFCQFYDTKKDFLAILVPYFKTGLENNEFCLLIASDPIDAAQTLKKEAPGFDRYIAEQKIEILSHIDWYLKGGRFDPKKVFNGWNKKLNLALERDYTGMRVSANVGWIENRVGKDFIEYEKELNRFLYKKRMIVLCTYALKETQAKDVLNVAVSHDCVVSKRKGQWEILEIPENKKTKAQIQRENEELEQRVKERTIQLDTTNKQLRKLSAHLQNIQENERTAIAREIHDELGQQLTALKMDFGWLSKKLGDDITLKEKVNEILSLISGILKTVKRIAFELRPNILDNLGLIAALKWQGKEFEKRTGIKSKFHTDLKDFIPERSLSTVIFRVYQEALTNVARHAQATQLETTLEKNEDYIKLIVKDNGQGFDMDEAKNKNSLGLIGMNERALMLQGELTIKSKKLKGTVVTLKIPLPETDKKES